MEDEDEDEDEEACMCSESGSAANPSEIAGEMACAKRPPNGQSAHTRCHT